MGAWKRFLAALALCAVLVPPVLADSRKDNIDVIIALDKSLSMENKIGGVREWVNSFIIDQLLIPGDYSRRRGVLREGRCHHLPGGQG